MGPRVLRIVDIATELGAPRAQLLRCIGKDERTLSDVDVRVPLPRLIDLWEVAMRATQTASLPIRVAERADVMGYFDFGYGLYTARSATELVSRLIRFHDVIDTTGRWKCTVEPERTVFTWRRPGPRTLGMRVANEQSLATLVSIGRQIVGDEKVLEVWFAHPKPDAALDAHEAFFRCPLRFGAEADAVILAADFVSHIPLGSNDRLSAHFRDRLEERLQRVGEDKSVSASVLAVIAARLPDGIPDAAAVANELGMSQRTLRRRLSDEGARYEKLLNEVQKETALERLREGASVAVAAIAAGFDDASAFARAFKRWTGQTPAGFRKAKS
jgi:AraC-like DNA-binding protein